MAREMAKETMKTAAKLSQKLPRGENRFYSFPEWTRSSTRLAKHGQYISQGLSHGDEMSRWGGKPASALQIGVYQLQGKINRRESYSRKTKAALVYWE